MKKWSAPGTTAARKPWRAAVSRANCPDPNWSCAPWTQTTFRPSRARASSSGQRSNGTPMRRRTSGSTTSGGPRRAERPEGEAGEGERSVRIPLADEPDGGDEVVRLAAPLVVGPLRGPDAPEVETERGEVEAVGEEPRGPVDDLRVHRPAEEGMRVRDDGGSRRVAAGGGGAPRGSRQAREASGRPFGRRSRPSEVSMRGMNGPPSGESAGSAARLEPWISLALVLLSAALAIHHLSGDAATADEPVHLAASVEIVRDGTGRWNPEHPPLAKALAGLALAGLPIRPADDPLRTPAGPARLLRFLYGNETPAGTILFRARLPFVALLAALLLAVRAEARRRWGAVGRLRRPRLRRARADPERARGSRPHRRRRDALRRPLARPARPPRAGGGARRRAPPRPPLGPRLPLEVQRAPPRPLHAPLPRGRRDARPPRPPAPRAPAPRRRRDRPPRHPRRFRVGLPEPVAGRPPRARRRPARGQGAIPRRGARAASPPATPSPRSATSSPAPSRSPCRATSGPA